MFEAVLLPDVCAQPELYDPEALPFVGDSVPSPAIPAILLKEGILNHEKTIINPHWEFTGIVPNQSFEEAEKSLAEAGLYPKAQTEMVDLYVDLPGDQLRKKGVYTRFRVYYDPAKLPFSVRVISVADHQAPKSLDFHLERIYLERADAEEARLKLAGDWLKGQTPKGMQIIGAVTKRRTEFTTPYPWRHARTPGGTIVMAPAWSVFYLDEPTILIPSHPVPLSFFSTDDLVGPAEGLVAKIRSLLQPQTKKLVMVEIEAGAHDGAFASTRALAGLTNFVLPSLTPPAGRKALHFSDVHV